MPNDIMVCTTCRIRVMPKASGKCPGCGNQIAAPVRAADVSATTAPESTADPSPPASHKPPHLLEERDSPQTAAGRMLLARDRKHSGSYALLLITVTLVFSNMSGMEGVEGLVWINTVAWVGLYAWSFHDPVAATGLGLGLAVVSLGINFSSAPGTIGANAGLLALLASSHTGHRQRARTGAGRRRLVRASCEAEFASEIDPKLLRAMVHEELGQTAEAVEQFADAKLWKCLLVIEQSSHEALAAVSWSKGNLSFAVRCFVPRVLMAAAAEWAMTLVRSVAESATKNSGLPQEVAPAPIAPTDVHSVPSCAALPKALPAPKGAKVDPELVPATGAANQLLDSLAKTSPARALLWTLLTSLFAVKLGVETAILFAPRVGVDMAPGWIGDLALFPQIADFSLLPLFYGNIPGPGILLLLVASSRCRQHWLEHAQRRRLGKRASVLYLRSFCDDPERPNAWQLFVNQFQMGFGGRNNSTLAYSASVELRLVSRMLQLGFGTIAVQSPEDKGLRLGALRVALPHATWEPRVHGLMQLATMVVLRLRATPGTQRELQALLSSPARQRALVLYEKGTLPLLVAAAKTNGLMVRIAADGGDASAGVFLPATGEVRPVRWQGALHSDAQAVAEEVYRWARSAQPPPRPRDHLAFRATMVAWFFPLLLPFVIIFCMLLARPIAILRHQEVTEVTIEKLVEYGDGPSWAFRLPRDSWQLPSPEAPCLESAVPFAPSLKTIYYRAPIERIRTAVVVKETIGCFSGRRITGSPTNIILCNVGIFEGVPPHVRAALHIPAAADAILVEAVNHEETIAHARLALTITGCAGGGVTAIVLLVWGRRRLRRHQFSPEQESIAPSSETSNRSAQP